MPKRTHRVCVTCDKLLPIAAFGSRARHGECADCRVVTVAHRAEERRQARLTAVQEAIASGVRLCAQCGIEKPREMFDRDRGRPDGVFPYCKQCRGHYKGHGEINHSDYQNEHRAELARKRAERAVRVDRNAYLRRQYGITLDDYDRMLTEQGGGCAICARPPGEVSASFGKRAGYLAVDHDHACCPGQTSCGECVRGLLCGDCNSGIGSFEDDAQRLQQATRYLTSRGGRWGRQRLHIIEEPSTNAAAP